MTTELSLTSEYHPGAANIFQGQAQNFLSPYFFFFRLFNNQDSRSNQLQLIRYIFLLGDNLLIAFSLPCKERVSFNDGAFSDCFIEYYIT